MLNNFIVIGASLGPNLFHKPNLVESVIVAKSQYRIKMQKNFGPTQALTPNPAGVAFAGGEGDSQARCAHELAHLVVTFTYRFNRRCNLFGLMESLIDDAAQTPPMIDMLVRGAMLRHVSNHGATWVSSFVLKTH